MRVIKQSKHYLTLPCCSLWEKLYFRTRLALRPKIRTCKFRHASREYSGASVKKKKSPSQVEQRLMSIFIKERHHLSKRYHLEMKNTRETLLGRLC